MSDHWIRASEIGEYVYCRRAWWLHRVQRVPAENREELARGQAHHQAHGAQVERARLAQRLSYALLALGVGLLVYALLQVG